MKKIPLIKMKVSQKGRIVEVSAGHSLLHKFMSMGVYNGREITKLSHFVLKGPVAIKVGRSVLALGYGMASKIIVEVE